jgi:hypothetical protein
MREQFKSKYSDIDAFYARADLLRSQFGVWDARDPIAHIILDLVEAQSELSDLFEDEGLYGFDSEAAFKALVEKRRDAGRKLWAALENRESWPDPDLGRR